MMKTNLNKEKLEGYLLGMRAAGHLIRSLSRSKDNSNMVAEIMKRANHEEMIVDKWRREGLI